MPGKPGKSRRRRRSQRRRGRSALSVPLLAVAAAGVVALAGGGTALAMGKSVTLDANGEETDVRTFGGTVQDALDSAGVELEEHDVVAPSVDTSVSGGDHVIVRSPRELTVDLDGHEHAHQVNAATVSEALDQIGLDQEGVELSQPHDTLIPAHGLNVSAERAPRVVVMHDTVRTETRTTGETVSEVLDAAGVGTGEHDIVSPEPGEPVEPDTVISVVPALGEPETEEVVIEAATVEEENPDLPEGEREVVTEPEDGVKEVTTLPVLRHGEETEHEISEEVVTEPVEGLVEVGTKESEEESDSPSEDGGEAGNLNWAGLAECESSGDATAVNSAGGYYGLYQFSTTTWESVGGSGLPSEASPGEQTERAQQLYNTVGGDWQSQWPTCGVHLFD
ncbi:ubiquitin-like domain-containing protein [Nocardiopsis nanhaiensis]